MRHYLGMMERLFPLNPEEDPFPEDWEPDFHRGSQNFKGKNGVILVKDISTPPSPDDETRAIDVATLVLQAQNFSITISISRGPDEELTNVFVVYNEWPASGAGE